MHRVVFPSGQHKLRYGSSKATPSLPRQWSKRNGTRVDWSRRGGGFSRLRSGLGVEKGRAANRGTRNPPLGVTMHGFNAKVSARPQLSPPPPRSPTQPEVITPPPATSPAVTITWGHAKNGMTSHVATV